MRPGSGAPSRIRRPYPGPRCERDQHRTKSGRTFDSCRISRCPSNGPSGVRKATSTSAANISWGGCPAAAPSGIPGIAPTGAHTADTCSRSRHAYGLISARQRCWVSPGGPGPLGPRRSWLRRRDVIPAAGGVGLVVNAKTAAPYVRGRGTSHVWAIDEGMKPRRLVTVPLSVATCRQ